MVQIFQSVYSPHHVILQREGSGVSDLTFEKNKQNSWPCARYWCTFPSNFVFEFWSCLFCLTPRTRASNPAISFVWRFARYAKALGILEQEKCSMSNAYRLANIARSTVRNFLAIAELKIVDENQYRHLYSLLLKDPKSNVTKFEAASRKKLYDYREKLQKLQMEGKLLPLKIEDKVLYVSCLE